MNNFNENNAYSRARNKVEKIRGFYKHLAAYIIINSIILGIKIVKNFSFSDPNFELWFDINFYGIWLFWGIGLAFHAFSVFGTNYFFGENWEEKKINKFMEEERYVNSNNK